MTTSEPRGAEWGANWGATKEESAGALACDELLPDARARLHRAISIQAPRATVFRWLCQLKLAPYSYDLLDNLGRKSPRELVDGCEQLEVGQRFMTIFTLRSFVPDEHLTLRSRGTAVTYAVRSQYRSTRLLARVLFDPPGGRLLASSAARVLTRAAAVGGRPSSCARRTLSRRPACWRLVTS